MLMMSLFYVPLLLISLEVFWLIQFIDCLQNQRDNRARWIAILLFLNVFGALYYWRLRPRYKMSRAEFDNTLTSWLAHRGFSLSKSENLLVTTAQTGIKFYGLIVFVSILGVVVDYIELPEIVGWIFLVFMLVFLIWMAVSVTKIWWFRKDLIVPFLGDLILQAKAGKKSIVPSSGNRPNDPITQKSLPILLMGIFFLFVAPVFSLGGLVHGIGGIVNGELSGIVMLCMGNLISLMILLISIKMISSVFFYYNPDYIFEVIYFYSFLKFILYGVVMTLIVGFGVVLAVLPITGNGG